MWRGLKAPCLDCAVTGNSWYRLLLFLNFSVLNNLQKKDLKLLQPGFSRTSSLSG